MSLKTRKSLQKRFKLTSTGKILRRPCGQDHLRSKMTGEAKRKGRKWVEVSKNEAKMIKKFLVRIKKK